MRHNLILRLDGMPGSYVQDIAADMQALADRLDICVALEMNGAHLITSPGRDVSHIQSQYEVQIGRKDNDQPA